MNQPDFISSKVSSGDYYFLDLEPDRTESVVVVCGGKEICGPNYVVERSTFPFWSIEYVLSGHGLATIDGNSFPIGPGTLFRYGPGIPHTIEVNPGSVIEKAFVDFAGVRADAWWTGPWQTLSPLHVPATAGIRQLFDELQRHGKRGEEIGARLCALVVEQIALLAADEAVEVDRSHSVAWTTYVGCRNLIESRFLELRTLADISALCHVGPAWLCRLFSQFDTVSPYQFLLRLKMTHAASRLADQDVLVKQVAQEIGYDPYHFSRVFKRVVGFSPEAFRRGPGARQESV